MKKPKIFKIFLFFCSYFLVAILVYIFFATPQIKKNIKIFNLLDSELILDLVGVGQVSKIENNVLTLTLEEEVLSIPLSNDVKVINMNFSLGYPLLAFVIDPSSPGLVFGDLSEIKPGDIVNVYLEIDKNGNYKGKVIVKFLNPYANQNTSPGR